LELVFERFYRADPARSRDRGGSGIGLTIARALVEAHGGRLWAESDGPGKGTRFLCRLPAA
jgi:signal transduction histidine kinase